MRKYIHLMSRPAIARDPRQSLILDSTPWIPASVEIGFQIAFFVFCGIKDSSGSIPDCKAQDS